MRKPDTFVLVVAALSEKLVQKENEISDLLTYNQQQRQELEDTERTISDLRQECQEMWDAREENRTLNDRISYISSKLESYEYMRTQNAELYQRVRTLENENYKLRFGGATPEETATAYMKDQGVAEWSSNRIGVIKNVRQITHWGLKEAKDWCDAYVQPQPATIGDIIRQKLGSVPKPSEAAPTDDNVPGTLPSSSQDRKAV